ncbi:hypothetical protein KR51_00030850 [Rubidibacter lacunae KORDI 51-2]|uniref:Uncharacterized protein n=1 Tax=Rubidibacter lacunae KORDI 51-2 TaxID=582515 RepID=U5DGZ9_9CHRO|nr:alr0857 family protein [Rubidibacter lacunae]ERN40537.1 hypothetical protein KR51_00030850 [Rubidibacter lacunae KORDI 51-2]
MLKLNYTEDGLYLERVAKSLEDVLRDRVVLMARLGETLYVESGSASFLLPQDAPGLSRLVQLLQHERYEDVAVAAVDDECVEICMEGCWMAASPDADTGTFLTALDDETEFLVARLWEATQVQATFLA